MRALTYEVVVEKDIVRDEDRRANDREIRGYCQKLSEIRGRKTYA